MYSRVTLLVQPTWLLFNDSAISNWNFYIECRDFFFVKNFLVGILYLGSNTLRSFGYTAWLNIFANEESYKRVKAWDESDLAAGLVLIISVEFMRIAEMTSPPSHIALHIDVVVG